MQKIIDDIWYRLVHINEKCKALNLLYGDKDINEAWSHFKILGLWYRDGFIVNLYVELRTLIDYRNDTINFRYLLSELEKNKNCKYSEERKMIDECYKGCKDFINQNITHKAKNVTINSFGYDDLKNIIEKLKLVLNKLSLEYNETSKLFDYIGTFSVKPIIKEFNKMLISAHLKREKEKERRRKELLGN